MSNTQESRHTIAKLSGFGLILLGLVVNPFSARLALKPIGIEVVTTAFYFFVISGQLIPISLGWYILRNPERPTTNKWAILSLAVSTVLCLLLLNLSLSLALPETLGGQLTQEFYYMYRPHDEGSRYPGPDDEFARIPLQTNSLSMRGPEIPEKRPEEYRVLLLGDSFIQADEILFGETVGQVLQKKLPAGFTILQQGHSGWSPLLELNFLVKNYEALRPDEVVLFLFVNDFWDASVGKSDAAYMKRATLDEYGYPVSFRVGESASFVSRLLRFKLVKTLLRIFRKTPPCAEHYSLDQLKQVMTTAVSKEERLRELDDLVFLENTLRLSLEEVRWDDQTTETVDGTFESILRMNEFLKQNEATLKLVLIPAGFNIDSDENSIGKQKAYYCMDKTVVFSDSKLRGYVARRSADHNIEYIEVVDSLREEKRRSGEALYLRADGHWTARAHAAIADLLYRNFRGPEKAGG